MYGDQAKFIFFNEQTFISTANWKELKITLGKNFLSLFQEKM